MTDRPTGSRRRSPVNFRNALVWVGVSYAFALAGQLAANGVAARLLGRQDYAHYVAVITATILISQLGIFGLQTAALRDASAMRRGADPLALAEHLGGVRSVVRISLPVFGVVSGVVVAALVHSSSVVTSLIVVASVASVIWVSGQQRLHANYLRGFGEVRLSSLLEGRSGGALLLTFQALAIGALAVFRPHATLAELLVASGVAGIPGCLIGRYRVMQRFDEKAVPWRPWKDLVAAYRRSRGFAALQTGIFLDAQVDILVAVACLAATQASLFASAQRVAVTIIVPTALLQMVMSPVVVRLRGDRPRLEKMLRSASTVGVGIAGLVAIPLIVGSPWISSFIFGNDFRSAAPILSLISVGYFVRVAAGLATVSLSMNGLESVAARTLWIGIVARCVIGGALGHEFGVYGLTAASVVITCLVYFGLWLTSRRRLSIVTHPTLRPALRQLLKERS